MPHAQEQALSQLLQQQQGTLGQLLALIEQETTALVERNADTLLQLAGDKQQLLQQLAQTDKLLSQHPQKAQLKAPPLAEQVSQAQQLLAQCQLKNQSNGKLIELCAASVNRLAQALQVSRNASSLTYDGKGKTSTISTLGNDVEA
ncbi:flagellar export chaperone FlgN [Shewanella sp. YIC-542]|uniref:flagellar export chaperone FlgN n=1 Tax=Shewanella mytili TaxID=3377111 RepID=UPI00398E3D8C